jgi:hypothetical protein
MIIPDCPLPVWRELYDKAIAFRETACWEWMSDSSVFGVQNIDNDEIGYCCVLGEMGEVFGLVVYLGSEGLEIYRKIQSGKMSSSSTESRYGQNCLTTWFSNRGELDKTELATAKQLGHNFKGRNVWPQFRSMRPGYCPWHVTESEAIFLTDCLEQARLVALRLKDHTLWLDPPKKNHYLLRVPCRGNGAGGEAPMATVATAGKPPLSTEQQMLFADINITGALSWRDEWRAATPLLQTPVPAYPVDEVRLQRIKNIFRSSDGIWEINAFYTPSPIAGDDRPYYPYTFLCVDHDSGMILDTTLAEPSKWPSEFPNALLKTIESTKLMPSTLWLGNGPLLELLEPLAARLGIEAIAAKKLPSLADAKRELLKFLDRQL